jgi:hypothetical protein
MAMNWDTDSSMLVSSMIVIVIVDGWMDGWNGMEVEFVVDWVSECYD